MPEQRPIEGEHEYEQHITSPEHHEEHPGKGLITTNHDAIRQWAEKRDATPATVPGSEYEGRPGRLLFDFPGYGGESLVNISWDDWFETFDERRLNFSFQEHGKGGQLSNFFQLENPHRTP